jgi:hypothetical protein
MKHQPTSALVAVCNDAARHINKELPASAIGLRNAAKKLKAQQAAIRRFITASDRSSNMEGNDIDNMIEWNAAHEALREFV